MKKLIPCIYLLDEKCVKSFEDKTVVSEDPISYAKGFCDAKADELLIFDLSYDDKSHEASIDLIHEICQVVTVPVIGAGNVKRMEDIKKLLYAGCKKAVLNFSKEENVNLIVEVSQKFGKEKIAVAIKSEDEFIYHEELLKQYADTIVLLDAGLIKELNVSDNDSFSFITILPEVSLDKLIGYLNVKNVEGVSGETVNCNAAEYMNIKSLIKDDYVPFSTFKLNSDGMIPCIVQDYKTGQVLMLAYMNEEAYNQTVRTKTMTYFSRSRQSMWLKGETSGHFQYLKSLSYDCDNDTLLAKVEQIGAACHTGSYSCFFNEIIPSEGEEKNPLEILTEVYDVIKDRKVNPKEGSYTNYLFDKGVDKILKKVGEEATEIVIAAKNPNPNEIKYEISDFLYHVMVLMVEKGVTWDEIMYELANR